MEPTQPGVLGTLGINWKQFLAQLINFGIILYIFWKWIVKPLARNLTQRQERIEEGLKNAEKTQKEKLKFEEWRQNEHRKARNEADQILRTATDMATQMKQEIIHEAQTQSDKLLVQAKQSIEFEKQQMLKEVKTEVATLVVAVSEKILRTKLDPRKDHKLINESLKNVKGY